MRRGGFAWAARVDAWIHGFLPATAHGLAIIRIFFAAYLLLAGIPTFSWMAGNPPGLYAPPPFSLAAAFGSFPPRHVLLALDLAIAVLVTCVLVGYRTILSSTLLSLCWIVGNSFRYSFGKIDHTILAVLAPAVLALAGWGARYSIDARRGAAREPVAWPLTLMALLVAFGWFSAGLPKLLVWADFDLSTQGARSWLFATWFEDGRRSLLAARFLALEHPVFWEAADLVSVAFETGFLLSLLHRSLFRGFLFAAVMFHLANVFWLNIGFAILIPVYAAFLPWERVRRLPAIAERVLTRVGTPLVGSIVLASLLPLYLWVDDVSADTAADGFSHAGVVLDLALGVDFAWWVALVVLHLAALTALVVAGAPRVRPTGPAGAPGPGKRVVFFDGVCNLCNGFVDFLIRRDRRGRLHFASLQSPLGASVSPGQPLDAMLYKDAGGAVFAGSDAFVRAVEDVGGVWRVVGVLRLVPRPVREGVYRFTARRRYRIFGRRAECRVPTPEERGRFL